MDPSDDRLAVHAVGGLLYLCREVRLAERVGPAAPGARPGYDVVLLRTGLPPLTLDPAALLAVRPVLAPVSAPAGGGSDDPPEPLTPEDAEALGAELARRLARAFGERRPGAT